MKKQIFITLTVINISILADSWKEKFNKYNPFAKKEQNIKTQKELNAAKEDWKNEVSAHDNRHSQDPLVREGQSIIDSQHSESTKELFNMIKDLKTKTSSEDLAKRYNSADLLTQKAEHNKKFDSYIQKRKNEPLSDEEDFKLKYHTRMGKLFFDAYEQRKTHDALTDALIHDEYDLAHQEPYTDWDTRI